MEYKSPLEDAYEEHTSYGKRQSHTLPAGRYAPYTIRRNQQEGDPPLSRSVGPSTSRQDRTESITSHGQDASHHNSMQHRYTDRYKPSRYPRELTAMFGADECKLCAVELKSPIVAKMHYSGKQHLKKIKLYLTNWSDKTGLPMPDVKSNNSVHERVFPEYCEVCDVHTKLLNDQLLHYSGKIHRKNMLDPTNAKKKKKTYETLDLSGRFGIGQGFSSKVSEVEDENKMEVDVIKSTFTCELCDVTAASQDQLDQHLIGKKHKEKVEKKDSKEKVKPWKCIVCDVSLETQQLYNLHVNGKRHAKNTMKIEMTGIDNCEVCDVSFTSLEHYQAHMAGKKHEKRCQLLKALHQKSRITCEFCPFVGDLENHDCDKSLTKMDFENLEKKWVCTTCHNMVFESEMEYNDHKNSNRHILCLLNQEEGDPVNEDLKHVYCILCKKQYQEYKEYTDHLFEEKHMRLSREQTALISNLQLFQCSVCNLTLTEQLKDQHMQSRQHIRESLKKDTMLTLTDLANDDLISMTFSCDYCHVGQLTFIQYSQHMLGENHINVMIDSKLMCLKH